MTYESHEFYMTRAFQLAVRSYSEGGCPIGAVLVANDTGEVCGEGHNALVQEGNPILHGEMAALRAAGRMTNRHNTTLYATLQPCFMCTGAIASLGFRASWLATWSTPRAMRPSVSCAAGASR